MEAGKEALEALLAASPEEAEAIVREMDGERLARFLGEWPAWVHGGQEPPPASAGAGRDSWRVWVMMAGRGFGKTRAGAEWVSALARRNPRASFALVGATADEARRVMVEGRSGLIAVARPAERRQMRWEPSRRRLAFASGAEAFLYSGANADSLRGPEHHFAWCDELAKWDQAEEAWANLMLGLRLGERPRALVTTTPKSIAVLRAIIADPETAQTGGATADNPHLAEGFAKSMERRMGGSRLGRQELHGELLDEAEGALWPRDLIEGCRTDPHPNPLPQAGEGAIRRVVIGVDPPAGSSGDACGIVVVGLGEDGVAYVLGDHSVRGLSPDGWARKVASAAEIYEAARVVAEANNGGRMVESVLRGAGLKLPLRLVHAAEGKIARAAPVAALFESGRAKFAGRFPALEAELAGLGWNGRYEVPGRSPDRADAMVWAMTELMLKKRKTEPRIHRF